jgi:ABC-type branched-subunit amino acid transport system permease subunit
VLSLGSVNVGVDQLLTFGIAVAITIVLAGFLARSRLGVAMRGVVDDPDLINLSGTNPAGVRRAAWAIGSSVAALSGILIAPTLGLDAVLLTYLVIQAFGAAAIGRFASMPRTFAGGLVVGVGASLATKYVGQIHWLTGFPPSFPFIVLFGVLLFTRRGRFIELGSSPTRVNRRERRPLPASLRRGMGVVFAVVVLAVPSFAGVHLSSYADAAVFVLIFASLRLLVVTSGQVSLCHAAFAAVGATTFSHLTTGAHWPWLIALLASALVAVPVGAVVALPAIRLSGLYLALATFGFGVLLQRLVYPMALMFGSKASLVATRPSFGGLHLSSDKAFYFLCLAIVAAGVGLVHILTRSRLGRLLRALADSPTALTTLGGEVNLIRTLVFCISAFLAAIGGALYAGFIGSFGPNSFDALLSLTLLVVLAIAGAGEISAPVIAAVAYILVPSYIQSSALNEWLPVLFGVSAIAVAVVSARPGRPPALRMPERVAARGRESPVRYRLEGSASAP